MKNLHVSLLAVNAKYIHSNLAVMCLKDAAERFFVTVIEANINENYNEVTEKIFEEKPDILGISCYIWNIEFIKKLLLDLPLYLPECRIILGGPEVSFDFEAFTELSDYIVRGEGEIAFVNILEFESGLAELELPYKRIGGCVVIEGKNIDFNAQNYTKRTQNRDGRNRQNYTQNKDKIIYYESSRGCPSACAYCLSSTAGGVRFKPLDVVKSDLKEFIESGCGQVKFVDRTFNADKKRAVEILEFLCAESGEKEMNFHFEIAADLVDKEFINTVQNSKAGLFQFEIGIQSFNAETLKAVNRRTDLEKLRENIKALIATAKAHIHIDLIAGLPFEDYKSFRNSFNQAYNLGADMLQLGFLKLLKGTSLRDSDYFTYSKTAPYEIIKTRDLSAEEVFKLKRIEDTVEKFANSGRFKRSLTLVVGESEDAFTFFEEQSVFNNKSGGQNLFDLYKSLKNFYIKFTDNKAANGIIEIKEKTRRLQIFSEALLIDFLTSTKTYKIPKDIFGVCKYSVNNQNILTAQIGNKTLEVDYNRQNPVTNEFIFNIK